MNFHFSEEQSILRDSIQKFIQSEYEFEKRRREIAEITSNKQGFNRQYWKTMAELGWLCIPFSEEDGGIGGSPVDIMIIMEEFGKGLVIEPYLPTVILVGGLLSRLGTETQKSNYLQDIIEGRKTAALAAIETGSRFDLGRIATRASHLADSISLSGKKTVVLNGGASDFYLVTARNEQTDEPGVYLVDGNARGIQKQVYTTVDDFDAAELAFDNTPAERLGNMEQDHLEALLDTQDDAILALGAEATGAMEMLYKMTVEYSKTRQQFGLPIGKFQVLQHRMADMYIQYELTKSVLYMAAITLRDGTIQERRKAASALKAQIGKAGRYIGQQAVQLHGGMGMTDELSVGNYFKRLTMIENLFGNTNFHLQRFADLANSA